MGQWRVKLYLGTYELYLQPNVIFIPNRSTSTTSTDTTRSLKEHALTGRGVGPISIKERRALDDRSRPINIYCRVSLNIGKHFVGNGHRHRADIGRIEGHFRVVSERHYYICERGALMAILVPTCFNDSP